MKPSEWIEQNKLIKGKQPSSIWSDLKELDKRFIDKEELKEKIQTKMMGYGLDFDRADIRPKYKQHSGERYNELEQVLELLEE